jgi:hypothetical protein
MLSLRPYLTLLSLFFILPSSLFTSSPLHLFTSSPLHLFTSSPLHLFTSSPLHLFTSSLTISSSSLFTSSLAISTVRGPFSGSPEGLQATPWHFPTSVASSHSASRTRRWRQLSSRRKRLLIFVGISTDIMGCQGIYRCWLSRPSFLTSLRMSWIRAIRMSLFGMPKWMPPQRRLLVCYES